MSSPASGGWKPRAGRPVPLTACLLEGEDRARGETFSFEASLLGPLGQLVEGHGGGRFSEAVDQVWDWVAMVM